MELASAITDGNLKDVKEAISENPENNWRDFLFWTFKNENLTARIEILNWMLDHGADPAYIEPHGKINILHILFAEREHDYIREAKLLQRFLDGGADINLKAPKWNVPIRTMLDNYGLSDKELGPFYDVIFSYPGIDWDIIVGKPSGHPMSLRELVDRAAERRPDLHRRMHDYLQHGPSPRPEFN